jgi:hypothetical protein
VSKPAIVAVFDLSAPLTRKDAIFIASRALTAYFLAWLIAELLSIPGNVYHAWHYLSTPLSPISPRVRSDDIFLRSIYVQQLCVNVIRAALSYLAAGWAYRCGPGVTRFLFPGSEKSPDQTQ